MAILDKINLNGEEREIADSEARQRLDDLAEVANTGDYDDLENKPDIPEAQVNADWEAESGVAAILNKPAALPNPMPLTFGNQTYDGSTSAEITPESIGLGTVFNLKGSKGTVADLPEAGNTIGDVWYVIAESVGYVWIDDDGTERWEQLGLAIDLSNYVTNAALALALAGKQNSYTTQTITLDAEDWDEEDKTQTVTVQGVTANNDIDIFSAPVNYEDYGKAGVYGLSQEANSVTFKCGKVPEGDLNVYVRIWG